MKFASPDFHLRATMPALFAGLIIGATMVLWSVTIAALIFSGELQGFVARATGFFLFGSMCLALVVALKSSCPGTIAASDESAAVIVSLIASSLVASQTDTDPESIFLTVMIVVVSTTLMCGLIFIGLGRFKLGNIIRFIPLPVVGGTVVTMGWLMVVGSFGVMMDTDINWGNLPDLGRPDSWHKWLPGVLFALVMLATHRAINHYSVIPVVFAAALGIFYLWAYFTGISSNELRSQGWLLGPFPDGFLFSFPGTSALEGVDWSVFTDHGLDIASLGLMCLLSLLLSATGIELTLRQDIDLNRELIAAGTANLFAGIGGGVTGSHSVEDTVLASEMGAPYRVTGVITAVICALAIVFGVAVLNFLPTVLLGGFILFFGLILIAEWIVDGFKRLPAHDYAVILACLIISATVGYLVGIAFGILSGTIIFVITYSRIDVVKHEFSGSEFHSKVERDPESKQELARSGDSLCIFRLHGYLFFGTVYNIISRVEKRLSSKDRETLRYLLLDFGSVDNVDASAVSTFLKIQHMAQKSGFQVLFSGPSAEIRERLLRMGVLESEEATALAFDDLDTAIEYCEEDILERAGLTARGRGIDITDYLEQHFDRPAAEKLCRYLDRIKVAEGDYLIRQDAASTDLYILETGRVAILLEVEDQGSVRLRSMGAGTVVGEVALYLGAKRTASVVAETESVVHRMTQPELEAMKENDPGLAADFHAFIVRVVAQRLADNNRLLQAILQV